MTKNDNNMLTKNKHWECEICLKKFKHQSSLWNHNKRKHKNINNEIKTKKANKCPFCDKSYSHASSLSRHKMKCKHRGTIINQQITNYDNCYNTNNNINNKININFYLNETCKNALNLTDFVKQIAVSLEDILKTKSLGYSEGVSEILIKNLNDLPQEDRPVQCSDLKPLEYYVKDDGEWSKNEISKMQSAIGKVTKKQAEQLKEWCKNNPNWNETEDGIKEWRSIQKNIMGSSKENVMVVEKNTIIEKVCESSKIKV